MKERQADDRWECPERHTGLTVLPPTEISAEVREAIITSTIATQALEGLHLSREMAEELFDDVMREPFPKIEV